METGWGANIPPQPVDGYKGRKSAGHWRSDQLRKQLAGDQPKERVWTTPTEFLCPGYVAMDPARQGWIRLVVLSQSKTVN